MDNAATLARKQRIRELEELIARPDKLSPSEYIALLHEVRKNFMAKLAILSVQSLTTGTGAIVNIIDKVHWLIDNIEGRSVIDELADQSVSIKYEMDYPVSN